MSQRSADEAPAEPGPGAEVPADPADPHAPIDAQDPDDPTSSTERADEPAEGSATTDTEAWDGTASDLPLLQGDTELEDEGRAPLEEVVTERPLEAAAPLRGPVALGGVGVAGFLMGTAEVVPGFSGGTVALVVGIYERLIANIRQGARALSLLVRGRVPDALRALFAIEWPFVAALLVGMLAAIFSVASVLQELIEEQATLLKAVLFGLVLGAAVLASRELRAPNPLHVLVGVAVAFGVFFGLGATGGLFLEPTLLMVFLGGAVAVCAWILPGISGSFILLLLGLWPAIVGAVADRDLLLVLVLGLGCILGLAVFSTALNWLLARFHDVVLAALIGLMVGSVRALWPYPSDAPFENVELGAPEGTESLLALALGLAAFSLVWMLGLIATAITRRRARRRALVGEEALGDVEEPTDPEGWGPPAGERPPPR